MKGLNKKSLIFCIGITVNLLITSFYN